MPSWDTIKTALSAFVTKFRSEAQGIDEIDRDNPTITTAIKYTGGKITLKPVVLEKTVALDACGVPVYELTLECDKPDKETLDALKCAKEVELATIESHTQTQNYHVVSGLILGVWGAFIILLIVNSLTGAI